MDLPIVKDTAISGEKGVSLVGDILSSLGHIFRPNEKYDFGIDGQIEIVTQGTENHHATGRLIVSQIKCGPSFLRNEIDGCYVHYCSSAHATYWLGHSLPVIVVLCNPKTSECFWVRVDNSSLHETKEGAKILVPKANRLSESESALVQIASSKTSEGHPEQKTTYEFPLNSKYEISLADDELAVLCAEISWAFKEGANISIGVGFENEATIAKEADIIRSANSPTVEQRARLLELKKMYAWFTAKRKHIARGIQILLKEDFIRLAGIETNDPPSGSVAVRAFVEYYIFHRIGQKSPSDLVLDTFSETGPDGLVAKIFLDSEDKQAFLHGLDLGRDIEPLKWPSYYFIDLGHDLILKRGIPAVVTAVLFHLDRSGTAEDEFFSATRGTLYEWRLGLA